METAAANDDSPPGADTRYGYAPQFQLWTLPPRDLSIEKSVCLNFASISPLRYACDLEFNIMPNHMMYADLKNAMLYCMCKVVHEDGTDLADDENVSLTNYPIASLFQKVDLYIQQQIVSTSGTSYPYKAMFDVLLESDWQDMDGILKQGLFAKDQYGRMDSTHLYTDPNEGFCERNDYIANSQVFELMGKLHVDLMRQERALVNGLQITLKLTQSTEAFRLMCPYTGDPTETRYKVLLLGCTLKVPMLKPTAAMLLAHDKAFSIAPALYPFERTEIKIIAIPAGMSQWTQDNLFLSSQPKRLLIAFVASAAFNGHFAKNPFNFKHYNVTYICLTIDGSCVPSQAIQPDYKNGLYLPAYNTLYSIAPEERVGRPRKVTTITRTEYAQGYCLYLFNLDGGNQGNTFVNPLGIGLNKLDIKFGEPLPEPVTLIMYPVYNALFRVDQTRNVKVEG